MAKTVRYAVRVFPPDFLCVTVEFAFAHRLLFCLILRNITQFQLDTSYSTVLLVRTYSVLVAVLASY